MKTEQTVRGFDIAGFTDRYGSKCSIQKSSIATEDCIWFGVSEVKARIMCHDAINMGIRERTGTESDNGWCDYQIPREVSIATRMHLTREMAKELLPYLQKFIETGELS